MSTTQSVSKHFKMGYRYFKPVNLLILKPEELLGIIFIAVDNFVISMYQGIELDYKSHFPYTLRIIKVYDKRTQVWKVPTRILHPTIDVSARWFVGRATLIQCDENGE